MTEPINELVDAGLATPRVWSDHVNQVNCGRSNCKRTPASGHDFCDPCGAWLRAEIDEDPREVDERTVVMALYGAMG